MTDGMIDWLYQSTLDISIIIVLILLIRNPVRRLLGAHISYWLWTLPLLRLIFSEKFERPAVITEYLPIPASNDLIPVYTGPLQPNDTQIEIVTAIWLLGLIFWVLLKIAQTIKFKSLLRKYSKYIPTDAVLTPVLSLKFSSKIKFKESSAIDGPFISGLLNNTVYLPVGFFEDYNENQRHHIIEHELTHAKRKDLWAQFMAEIFKAIFWFNPLIHIAWSKFQEDQELACDHQVLKHADHETRHEYGITLSKGLSALLTPNSLTFFNHKHERFIMLSKHKNNLLITFAGMIIIIAIAYVMLTKTPISLKQKSIDKHGQIVSFNFKGIPLESIAMLMSDATPGKKKFIGSSLLQGKLITADAIEIHAFDFFDALLNDHGLKVNRQDNVWQFSKL